MSLVVSAPGKVILFGDHSVVYNRRAIAASISLRTVLTFSPHNVPKVILDFPDIALHLSLTCDEIATTIQAFSDKVVTNEVPDVTLESDLTTAIDVLLVRKGLGGVNKAAAAAFLFLFCSIGSQSKQAVLGTYHITSDLPIGAGLGSSASVSVIIATTLLLLTERITRPGTHSLETTDQSHLSLINKWAYVGEQCIHGTPSGVDNTVATYGAAVAFQKSLPIQLVHAPALPLLLTNTGVPRSTKTQVAGVATLRENYPDIVEPILDAMHQIALEAQNLLPVAQENKARLGHLIQLNQGLLRTLGVSHPSIEKVIQDNSECGWTKLIGAGGGGCVITLLNDSTAQLDGDVKATGSLEQYNVVLGGPGVGIHDGSDIFYYLSDLTKV